jgi:hypothetical protein
MARTKAESVASLSKGVSPETTPPRSSEAACSLVELEVPLSNEVLDPVPHYVEIQLRSQESKAGMARLRDGLMAQGARLADTGRVVANSADAVRYLLEQLSAN